MRTFQDIDIDRECPPSHVGILSLKSKFKEKSWGKRNFARTTMQNKGRDARCSHTCTGQCGDQTWKSLTVSDLQSSIQRPSSCFCHILPWMNSTFPAHWCNTVASIHRQIKTELLGRFWVQQPGLLFKALPPPPAVAPRRNDPLSHLETSVGVFSSHSLGSNSGGFLPTYNLEGISLLFTRCTK